MQACRKTQKPNERVPVAKEQTLSNKIKNNTTGLKPKEKIFMTSH